MDVTLLTGLEAFLRTLSQILTAGISITAFALCLYIVTFNLRDRVVRTFLTILVCVVIVSTSEAIGSTLASSDEINIWVRIQWIGIIFLPGAYFQFSDALLATTGKPSRGRRRMVVILSYCFAITFMIGIPFLTDNSQVSTSQDPVPFIRNSAGIMIFLGYYLILIILAWYNFIRAVRRTQTTASRRRMVYLTIGSLAPALGTFPYMALGAEFATQHHIVFWLASSAANFVLGLFIVIMAYSVSFFGVSWPDRVIKARLLKWLLRGPVTASITLGVVTIVRRIGAFGGEEYSAWVPISMVAVILLCEFLITILAPYWERTFVFEEDRENIELLRTLENRMLTNNDLNQFLEMIVAAVCDRLQAKKAVVWAADTEGFMKVVEIGEGDPEDNDIPSEINSAINNTTNDLLIDFQGAKWKPLLSGLPGQRREALGVMKIFGLKNPDLDGEQLQALQILSQRAVFGLRDRLAQNEIISSLQVLTPQVEILQRIRAAASYNESNLFQEEIFPPDEDLVRWVREALGHYWGGPKLTDNPLIEFRVVENAIEQPEGSQANALRAILREAIDQVKPTGERKFTSEWILFNILEMKYMEGRKMRDIATRLALSEADLYRKQRVALEAVAQIIWQMEEKTRKLDGNH